mmetsp:Transcript_2588/g.5929  ORF Transcript_2588/g.5929 Transcript_2588/m.5929 type:complete len:156 (+) Transcript_2588:96-563(+)
MALRSRADDFLHELMQTEASLEKIARKLELEFAERFSETGVNPLSLVKRIQKLQSELPELRNECQGLIQRKQDLIDAAKQQLSINRQRLHQLCTVSGMVPPDDSDVHEAFKQALQEWDAQCVAAQGSEVLAQPSILNRDELNRALASSMLHRPAL